MAVKQATGLNIKGIKELTAQLRALKDATASQGVAHMLGSVGDGYRKAALAIARGNNWPKEALESSFVDARWPQSRKGKAKVSIIFGFGKRRHPGYVEWGPGTTSVRKPYTGRSKGTHMPSPVTRKFGMSLATLYEMGGIHSVNRVTTWLPARPAWRPALAQFKPMAKTQVKLGMAELLRQHTGQMAEGFTTPDETGWIG